LIYHYHPARSGQTPLKSLNGNQGYFQTNSYSGYNTPGRQPEILLVGYWVHIRDKFIEVIKAKSYPKKSHA
jgi:hypothetical protein